MECDDGDGMESDAEEEEEVLDDEFEGQNNCWERYILQKKEYYLCGYEEQGKRCTYQGNRRLANLKRHIIAVHLNTR